MNNTNRWTQEEINFLKENYQYGTEHCKRTLINRSNQAITRIAGILGLKVSIGSRRKIVTKHTKETIFNAVQNAECLSDVLRNLGVIPQARCFGHIRERIKFFEIDTTHFLNKSEIARRSKNNRKSKPLKISESFIDDKFLDGRRAKKFLYDYNLKEEKCECCGLEPKWQDKPLVLILDHINGKHTDNRIENLRIVCPNCNSQLETHGAKNRKNVKTWQQKEQEKIERNNSRINGLTVNNLNQIKSRRKVDRPPYEQLKNEIKENGYLGTGRKYGVSDTAIRKWIKYYETYEN